MQGGWLMRYLIWAWGLRHVLRAAWVLGRRYKTDREDGVLTKKEQEPYKEEVYALWLAAIGFDVDVQK